jgi:hypothetical protein
LPGLADRRRFVAAIEFERCYATSMSQVIAAQGSSFEKPVMTLNSLKRNEIVVTLIEAVQQDGYAQREALLAPVAAWCDHAGRLYLSAKITVPALLRSIEAFNRLVAAAQLADLTLALKQCRQEMGAYPESLTNLVPKYRERLPEDPYNGETYHYCREGNGFVVYSVGPNKIDDAGKPPGKEGMMKEGDLVWCALK